jgi:RNA polymerase sigma factor (sigma-70 family)
MASAAQADFNDVCRIMNSTPETRASLLIRVRDPADQSAWHEFVEIYRPVILRMARAKGLQEADAEDLAQQVLFSVAKAVEQREHDSARARFRTWLHRVAHNAILNALTRGKPDRGTGDTATLAVLKQHESPTGPDSELLRTEHRREVFRWAARHVREEFQQDTWNAFWLTAVEGRDIQVVAEELAKNSGAVYAARSRIIRRIQEKVMEYEES